MQVTKELWTEIEHENQQAFAEVYRILYKRLYNYGRKFTTDEVLIEDSIQETLLSIWVKRKDLASIEYPTTYFYTSFRYSLFGKLKSLQKFTSDASLENEPDFAIDHLIIQKETDAGTTARINHALNTLTSRQREAIYLRFYEGMSYEEVANMLDITVKATYKIMARALEELRQILNVSACYLIFSLERSGLH